MRHILFTSGTLSYSFPPLSRRLFPPQSMKHIMAVVFTQTPEHIVCFRFQFSASNIFVIFDTHSRSERPFGPAFILSSDIDVIATHVNQLLTQPSISKSNSKQDVTTSYPITALVIESRDRPSAIDEQDLLTKSVAFLFEKLITVDRTPSNLDLDTLASGLEQLQVQETQSLVHAPRKQDNNRQTSHSKPLNRRNEFGWQLNLQVSSTSSAVDPKNNDFAEYPKITESDTSRTEKVKETPDVEDAVSDDGRRKHATYQFTNCQHVFMSRSNAGNNACMCSSPSCDFRADDFRQFCDP